MNVVKFVKLILRLANVFRIPGKSRKITRKETIENVMSAQYERLAGSHFKKQK